MEVLGYSAALVIGITLGLMGGGGSILTVPTLVYLFGLSAKTATTYSLFIVGMTSLVGVGLMARRGLVAGRVAAGFMLPAFVTVWLTRGFVVPRLPHRIGPVLTETALLVFFALLMLITAVSMLRPRTETTLTDQKPNLRRIILPALLVGLVTGLVGAGAGFLIVPALTLAAGLPMKRAVGTSLAVIAANSVVGFMSDSQVRPHANFPFLVGITAIAMVGMAVGAVLSKHIPSARLRPAFGVFLLVMGTYMLLRETLGHS